MANVYTKKSEDTWNAIAKSFDSTRRKPWKECIDFIKELPRSSIVADIGCGNGRHLIPSAKHCKKVIGVDVSNELLKIVQKKINDNKILNVELIHSDAVKIPLKDNMIDAALYIATLHNIPQRYRRVKSLSEINRVLKKDGKALISVWSRWQDKFRQHFIKKCLTNIKRKEFGDIDINWRQHGLNIPRFYHLYSKKELQTDIKQAGLDIIKIEGVKYFSKKFYDNYFAVVKKTLNNQS